MKLNKSKKSEKMGYSIFNSKKGLIFANCMVAIALIHFCIFYLFLNAQTFVLAFTSNPEGLGGFTLINFKQLFSEITGNVSGPTNIYSALKNTMKYFLLNIFRLFLSYMVGYFFFKKVKGQKALQYIFFIPSMISPTVVSTVFKEFINPIGSIGQTLNNLFGFTIPNLFNSNTTATFTIMAYTLWVGFGIQFMIFVGAMNRIPTELFEVARLDGCGLWKEIIKIVLPLTWETFFMYLLSAISGIFMSSGPILFFMGATPYLDVYTLDFLIFSGTHTGTINYPAAVSLFFTFMTVPIVVVVRCIMRRVNQNIEY